MLSQRLVILYEGTHFDLLTHFLMSVIIVWLITPLRQNDFGWLWLTGIIIVLTYRWLILYFFRKHFDPQKSILWERLFLLGVFLTGLLWGVLSLFFVEFVDMKFELLTLVTVVGIASSSVTTLNASPRAYPLFVLPALIPYILMFYMHGGEIYTTLSIMLAIFILMTLFLGRRVHAHATRLLFLDVENKSLIQRLEVWNNSLIERNEEISSTSMLKSKDNQLLEKMFENTDVLIAYMDWEFRYIRVNKAYANAAGKPVNEFNGHYHFDIFPNIQDEVLFKRAISSKQAIRIQAKLYEHPNLGLTYWNWALQPVLDASGTVQGLLLSAIDVTYARKSELDALNKQSYLHTIMETAADGIITTDELGVIESVNTIGASIFGYQKLELIGKNLSVLMPFSIGGKHKKIMQAYLSSNTGSTIIGRTLENIGRRKNGQEFPISVTVSESVIQGRTIFTGIYRDISRQKEDTDALIQARNEAQSLNETLREKNLQLEYLSSNDALTGIANRRKYNELIEREWERSKRNKSTMSVIIMDIDHFKAYNDLYGHQAGDECLQRVAQALAGELMRATDFVARYGGEEFVCVLSETNLENAMKVAERLRAVVESAGLAHEKSLTSDVVTISVGVASMIAEQGKNIGSLVSMSDKALYQAKNQGRNRVCHYGT